MRELFANTNSYDFGCVTVSANTNTITTSYNRTADSSAHIHIHTIYIYSKYTRSMGLFTLIHLNRYMSMIIIRKLSQNGQGWT